MSMTSDEDSVTTVWVGEFDGTEVCPVCGYDFGFDDALLGDSEWADAGGYYDHHSGVGRRTFACPTKGCAGEIEVRSG